MDEVKPPDVGVIAARVLEALSPPARAGDLIRRGARPSNGPYPDDRPPAHPTRFRKGSANESEDKMRATPDQEDVFSRMDELLCDLTHLYLAQQHLEQELTELQQQVHFVPASMARLEQWKIDAEKQLAQLVEATNGESIRVEKPDAVIASVVEEADASWRSVREVAQSLSLSESTVRRYVRQGKLPAVRLPGGRGLRLRWTDVVERMPLLRENG